MKRDMALVQALLEHVEKLCGGEWIMPPEMPNYTDIQIHYHVSLCAQADFLEVKKVTGAGDIYARYAVRNLTWNGHEMFGEVTWLTCIKGRKVIYANWRTFRVRYLG